MCTTEGGGGISFARVIPVNFPFFPSFVLTGRVSVPGLNLTFGACEQLLIAALECGLKPSEADDSAEQAPTGAEPQSEAEAEMAAMLAWAAKSIRLEWSPLPCPEHSRLDDCSLTTLGLGVFLPRSA